MLCYYYYDINLFVVLKCFLYCSTNKGAYSIFVCMFDCLSSFESISLFFFLSAYPLLCLSVSFYLFVYFLVSHTRSLLHCLSAYKSIFFSVFLFEPLSVYLLVYLSLYLSLFIRLILSVCPSISLSTLSLLPCLSVHLSVGQLISRYLGL